LCRRRLAKPDTSLPEAALYLLEISRRQLGNEKTHRKLQRLDKRILNVASQQHRIQAEENEEILAS
jgi:hypothetical protein